MTKVLKRNQIIIFVIALMLVSAGYLNFTATHDPNSIATSVETNTLLEMAGIGDAQLVSSNGVVEGNSISTATNTTEENSSSMTNRVSNEIGGNVITDNTQQTNAKITDSSQYFSSSKISRDTMYSQMIESYQKLLESEGISSDQKTIAQNEIKNINQTKNAIMIAENLIKTKGFEDVIIFVNDTTSISVIVKAKELSKEQIAQVQNIITRELKADINQVHISNKE